MPKVIRKETESFESLLRRFNRAVQQSGILSNVKEKMFHKKPISKSKRRISAIRKKIRRDAKRRAMILGE